MIIFKTGGIDWNEKAVLYWTMKFHFRHSSLLGDNQTTVNLLL